MPPARYVSTVQQCLNVSRTAAFYRDALGFRQTAPDMVQLDALHLELRQAPADAAPRRWEPTRAGVQFLSVDLKDLRAGIAKAPRFGGTALEESDVGQACLVADPDGQVLELVDMRTHRKLADTNPAWPYSSFAHFAQVASDLEKTRRFYEEALGCTFLLARNSNFPATSKLMGLPQPFRLDLVFLDLDGLELELLNYPEHGTLPAVIHRTGLIAHRVAMDNPPAAHHDTMYDPDGQPVLLA